MEERADNWQTEKIGSEGDYSSWQESIGLSWGDTLSVICISPLISLLTLSLTLSHVAKFSPCCR